LVYERDDTEEHEMLRVSFSSMTTARAAVNVLEAYGYWARQQGRDVVTDCPTLLAVPTIQKRVGLSEVERVELAGATDGLGSPAAFSPAPRMTGAERRPDMTA
jgi:hypothetical protein